MGNDIKDLMCKKEIREDFKFLLRTGMNKILEKVNK